MRISAYNIQGLYIYYYYYYYVYMYDLKFLAFHHPRENFINWLVSICLFVMVYVYIFSDILLVHFFFSYVLIHLMIIM